ncbi:MBL fold metallo-hydrolase [Candidatus Hodarchaeum mangrovi]
MEFTKITDILLWTSQGYGNSAALCLDNKLIVIDAMNNWMLAKKWRKIIEESFNRKVSLLFLTHHHADHCFGNQVFNDVSIISSEATRNIMIDSQKNIWTPENLILWEKDGYGIQGFNLTLPNLCFEKKISYHEKYHVELVQIDGHTFGSSYLWCRDFKILIAGDLIFKHQYPYGGDNTTDLLQWKKAIEVLIDLNPEYIVSGHGHPASMHDLIEIRDFLNQTILFIKKRLNEGFTPEDISNATDFPDYYSIDRNERRMLSLRNWATKLIQKNE